MKTKITIRNAFLGLILVLLIAVTWLAWDDSNQPHFVLAAPNVIQSGWSTVDAGGGTSNSTRFSLAGTFGQPEAGPPGNGMSGGTYQLDGGFWTGGSSNHSVYLPLLKN